MKHFALTNIIASMSSFMGILALWMAVTSAPASAVPLLWTLNDVTFNGGGTATGSFRFDADTNSYSDIAVVTSGGGTTETSFDIYTDISPLFVRLLSTADGPDYSGASTLSLSFLDVLTNAGGEVGLKLNSFFSGSGRCLSGDCGIVLYDMDGQFASGSVISEAVAQVPEPGSLAMLALGVTLLGFARRNRPCKSS